MIGLFHRASLLRYKHQLAEYADELVRPSEEERSFRRQMDNPDAAIGDRDRDRFRHRRESLFRQKSESLQSDLLRFRSIYWFTEVSNQIQGQELFAMLRQHLNLDVLYRSVCDDAANAAGVLQRLADERRAISSQTIARVGVLFVLLMPIIELLKESLSGMGPCSVLIGVTGSLLILFGLIHAIAGETVRDILWRLLSMTSAQPAP